MYIPYWFQRQRKKGRTKSEVDEIIRWFTGYTQEGLEEQLKKQVYYETFFEDDPILTDKKFQGDPTRSYRTKSPQRVVGEVLDWEGHSPKVLNNMLDSLDGLTRIGIEAIND